jgi:hypothetical protein
MAKRRPPAMRHLLSDAEVRRLIIRTSIALYPGECACPYSVTARGKSCGRRSVWSRHGDFGATCYPNEVSTGDLREWRVRHQRINLPTGRFRSM